MKVRSFVIVAVALLAGCGSATDSNNGGNNSQSQTIEVTENITADTTWESATYKFGGDLHVSAKLTIEPCTTVQVGARIFVENGGAIEAIGTEECPIIFTSPKATPAPGDWTYIDIKDDADNGNVFDHVIFEYGGNEHGIVTLRGGASFRNSTVRHTTHEGLELHNGRVLEFTNMTFEDIPSHPFGISSNDTEVVDGVTTTDVQDATIHVANGTMTRDGSWEPQSIPYQLFGDIHFQAGLEIQAGTHIQIAPSSRFFVEQGGSIKTLGEDGNQVIIESANDTKVAGDWQQFNFKDTADSGSQFQWTTIRHGGSNGQGALYVRAPVTLDHVTFEDIQECDVDGVENISATATDLVDCAL